MGSLHYGIMCDVIMLLYIVRYDMVADFVSAYRGKQWKCVQKSEKPTDFCILSTESFLSIKHGSFPIHWLHRLWILLMNFHHVLNWVASFYSILLTVVVQQFAQFPRTKRRNIIYFSLFSPLTFIHDNEYEHT